jgi:diguanylate cyclase (GGDEF)-like protein
MASSRAGIRPPSRFFSAVLAPVVICLIVTAAATLGFILWSAQGVDQRSLEHETNLARFVTRSQLDRIPNDQESATIWDEAIIHTKQNFDLDWLNSNLGVWMSEYFGHDEVIILNDQDRPIYTMTGGKSVEPSVSRSELADVQPMVAELRGKIANGGIDAYLAGTETHPPRVSDFTMVLGVPHLVSVVPIITDTGNILQPRGSEYLHISMVRLDAAYAGRLSSEYLIQGAQFTELSATSASHASLPVTSSTGRFITFFDWIKEAPGADMLRQTLPAMVAAFLAAGLIAFALVYQLWRKSRALEAGRAEAEQRALHDPLTSLPNRMSFEAALGRALAQRPSRDRRVSVLMLDLDRFKQVNDTLGHGAGDDLIEAVGQRLRQFTRPADTLSRLGGDEFAIVHIHTPGMAEPLLLSQRIIDAVGKAFDLRGSEAFVGVSIGIATADGEEVDSRELIRKADIALYEAKSTGRNRAIIFEEAMNELLQNRHMIEGELREALKRTDQLSVAYQPLFGTDHKTIIGAEALARWTHPRLGQVSPAHFIPVAEATGLIEALGEFVLREACTLGAQWPGQTMAVNISPAQLRNPRFSERVFAMLADTGMRPEDLEVEITEGILLEDAGMPVETLNIFRSAGIRIALDDFGTGYSSLNYLKRYPVDRIKIDRSFVSQLSPDSVSVPIVQAMVTLAHALKIEVTAEGVETQEQLAVLAGLGCNIYQGFLLSPPVQPHALEQLLQLSAGAEEPQAQVA